MTKLPSEKSETVTCPKCGNTIGATVLIDGMQWLLIGHIVIRNMHGVCSVCGELFYWSVGDRALAELIQHVLEMRHTEQADSPSPTPQPSSTNLTVAMYDCSDTIDITE